MTFKLIGPLGLDDHHCPKCNAKLQRREGKYGRFFWVCTGYPMCSHTMSDDAGCPIEREVPEVTTTSCPFCKNGFLLKRRRRKRGFYFTCSNFPECRVRLKKNPCELQIEMEIIVRGSK